MDNTGSMNGDFEEFAGSISEIPRVTAYSLAQRCIAASNGDREAAVAAFIDAVPDYPVLLDNLIRAAGRYYIRQADGTGRRQLKAGIKPAPRGETLKTDLSGLRALAEVQRAWLEDYALPDGSPLGAATIEDLDKAVLRHEDNIRGNRQSADFLLHIRAEVRDGKTVRDCLTNVRLSQIWSAISC